MSRRARGANAFASILHQHRASTTNRSRVLTLELINHTSTIQRLCSPCSICIQRHPSLTTHRRNATYHVVYHRHGCTMGRHIAARQTYSSTRYPSAFTPCYRYVVTLAHHQRTCPKSTSSLSAMVANLGCFLSLGSTKCSICKTKKEQ